MNLDLLSGLARTAGQNIGKIVAAFVVGLLLFLSGAFTVWRLEGFAGSAGTTVIRSERAFSSQGQTAASPTLDRAARSLHEEATRQQYWEGADAIPSADPPPASLNGTTANAPQVADGEKLLAKSGTRKGKNNSAPIKVPPPVPSAGQVGMANSLVPADSSAGKLDSSGQGGNLSDTSGSGNPGQGTLQPQGNASQSAPPAVPRTLTLPPNTPLQIRLSQTVSSQESHAGEVFRATLVNPLTVDGVVLAEAGTTVLGRIVDAHKVGLMRRHPNLNLVLTDLTTPNGRLAKIHTTQWYDNGSRNPENDSENMASSPSASPGTVGGKGFKNSDRNSSQEEDASLNKRGAVVVPAGTDIVFRLLDPLTTEVH